MPNFFNKYPYTDFHELNLDWILETVKNVVAEWAETLTEWHNTQEEWTTLYNYVHDYFDNLNVQEEINHKLDVMAADGSLADIAQPIIDAKVESLLPAEVSGQIGAVVADQIDNVVSDQIGPTVASQLGPVASPIISDWLTAHVDPVGSAVVVDNTLTIQGAAADAESVGDRFNTIYDSRNLCFIAEFNDNATFFTSHASNPDFCYFKLSITNGTTYYIKGFIRCLTKDDGTVSIISQLNASGTAYTADYTGDLYVTFRKTGTQYPDNYIVISNSSNVDEIAPFFIGRDIAHKLNVTYKGMNGADKRNILASAYHVPGYYYNNGAWAASSGYDVYIFHVTNGTTYKFYPGVRFLAKATGAAYLSNIQVPTTYTADYDGDAYLSVWNNRPDIKVCSDTDENVVPVDALTWNYKANQYVKFNRASVLNIGDSIAENRPGNVNYATQFTAATGSVLSRDVAEGGATLSLTSDQGARGCIYQQMKNTVDNYSSADYDIILVNGGTNDYGLSRTIGNPVSTGGAYTEADYTATFDITTICGALEEIFRLARNTYVNATIIFVIPHKNTRYNAYYYQILDAIREVCDKWSVTVVDMDKDGELNTRILSMRTDYTDAGGTHPNTLGVKTFYLPRIIEASLRSFNRTKY